MKSPKATIAIHNLNRARDLERCFPSVLAQTYRPLEVLLLDAGSEDDSIEVANAYKSQFEQSGIEFVIYPCKPMGVAASRNLAANVATGDVALFLDNDATLDTQECVSEAMARFHDIPALAVVACRVMKEDTSDLDPFCWVFRRKEQDWVMREFETFTFAGGACCLRLDMFRECGGYWECLEYSREEEDLAFALLGHGAKILYTPVVTIRHYPQQKGRRSLEERRRTELRNGLLIFWHRMPVIAAFAFSALRVCSMAFRLVSRREGSLSYMMRGVAETWTYWRTNSLSRAPAGWHAILRYVLLNLGRAEWKVNNK
jgi:glycosyltransferase involved in cell wall biosynthesis